ncbi:MAG: hypothetical protein QOH41_1254 [Blastocatellia bacterium]|jgi:hypothetical protein|nr:hypothetical protein [Blastocatellia bacterium]
MCRVLSRGQPLAQEVAIKVHDNTRYLLCLPLGVRHRAAFFIRAAFLENLEKENRWVEGGALANEPGSPGSHFIHLSVKRCWVF